MFERDARCKEREQGELFSLSSLIFPKLYFLFFFFVFFAFIEFNASV